MAENATDETTATAEETGSGRLEEAREKFRRVAGDLQGRAEKISGDARRGAQRATEEIRKSATRASAEVRRGFDRAGNVARERYEETSQQLREGYDRVSQDVQRASEDLYGYVRQNPGRSLLIATGIGFLVGLLMRGRHER